MTYNPNDTPLGVGHDRDHPSLVATNLTVDKEILEFLVSAETQWPKRVARTPVPNSERYRQGRSRDGDR